jgi:uncharacterized membrane protein
MYSEIIVIVFDHQGEARRIYDAAGSLRRSGLLALENATIVTKNRAGRVRFQQEWEVPPAPDSRDLDLLTFLTQLVFGVLPQDKVRAAIRVGLDERFLEQVAGAMSNESSALFFLVRPDSVSDAEELMEALKLFRGRIYRTTLPTEVVTALEEDE